jgi:hypothetical protein
VRPNIVKPKPAPALQNQDDSEEEQSGVPETQVQTSTAVDEFGSDFDESDYASDASHTPRRRKVPPKKTEEPKEKPVKEGVIKTAARKIAATANANYRRLNIKGKAGTSGKPKGKFGRRR